MPLDIERLEDSPHLLDVLLQMEDILDSLDTYVFSGWIDGTVVSGPDVRRHWLDLTLSFPYADMPDPRAALRLLKQGIRVVYEEARVASARAPAAGGNAGTATVSPTTVSTNAAAQSEAAAEVPGEERIWLVTVSIPRRLITEMNAGSLDAYDEEIDRGDVEDAQDAGVTDASGYSSEEDPEDDAPEDAPEDARPGRGGADA